MPATCVGIFVCIVRSNNAAHLALSSILQPPTDIIVVFLLTTTTFVGFACRPDDLNSRITVVFTVLLALVSFKYGGSAQLPIVSYPTILDSYILINFYICLLLGFVQIMISFQCTSSGINNPDKVMRDTLCSLSPGEWFGAPWIPKYNPLFEILISFGLLLIWLGVNYWYWKKLYKRVIRNLEIIDEVGLGWMSYKAKNKAMKGKYDAERLIRKPPQDDAKAGHGQLVGIRSSFYKSLHIKRPSGVNHGGRTPARNTQAGTPKAKAEPNFITAVKAAAAAEAAKNPDVAPKMEEAARPPPAAVASAEAGGDVVIRTAPDQPAAAAPGSQLEGKPPVQEPVGAV